MQLNLRIKDGDWGEGSLTDMRAVAESVIHAVALGLPSDARFDILLEQNEQPCALKTPSELGEDVIQIEGPAADSLKLAYELGHEFTHVMADAWSWDENDPLRWFEEVLADAGSLYALRRLAAAWSVLPPPPHGQWYGAAAAQYWTQYLAQPGRSLGEGADFKQWLASELPSLKVEDAQRPRFTIIARELLPVFERDSTAWRAIRYLHRFERHEGMTFAEFLKSWRNACPAESQRTVDAIAAALGVSYPATRTRLRSQQTTALRYMAAIRSVVSMPHRPSRKTSRPATSPRQPKRPDSAE